jgi:S-DNA-T family DNA segregation ATPase FtsK/SpoIIIE
MDKDKAIPRWNLARQDFTPYLLVCIGVFLLLSLFSFTESDDGTGANWFGRIGYYVSFTLFYLLGKSAFFLAGFSLILGVISFKSIDFDLLGKALFFPIFLIGACVSLHILETPMGRLGDGGGILGQFFAWMLGYLFGETGRVIVVFFLFIYSAIIWLDDTSWGFTLSKLNHATNFLYQAFGGKRDLTHLKLPSFLDDWVSQKRIPMDGGRQDFNSQPSKSWFEKRTELEGSASEPSPDFFANISEPVKPVLDFPIRKETGSLPKYKYKNTSLYHGFFEETGNVFRFHNASVSLQKKLRSEAMPANLYNAKVIDFRGIQTASEPSESFVAKESLVSLLPNVSDNSSLKMASPLVDFSDLDLSTHLGGEYEDDEEDLVIDQDEDDLIYEEEETEIAAEGDEEEIIDITNTDHQNFEIDDLEEETDDDLMEEESVREVASDFLPVSEEEVAVTEPSNVYAIEKNRNRIEKAKEKEEYPLGSMVPSVKLKKGKYYISHKLLADHKPTLAYNAKNEFEVESVIKKIEEIIGHFGVEVKVISKERGPIITRYELKIPYGVKHNKITTLVDEIRGHLEVTTVRIVAPIPGKSTIGIEVPNIHREDVFLSEILKDQLLQNKAKDLTISIGKDISGKTVNIDLAKLPHLLVAGTTGSGKSVSLNSMITSLICTRSPQEVRFIMIDPKMVEMTLYEDIPHLLMPVITDPRKATKALTWAINEMESRYQIVSKLKSRDFKSYNDKVDEYAHKQGYEKFPYIVIFIDELADLMMVSGKDIEEQITRISQKSRAVGIHLVMATQRPSVDVITGLIKANCPARVAFKVAQKTDSRTILDTNGAESLLGKGDFLYRSPVTSDLVRIQAPFIEEKEIEAIVEEAKRQGSPAYVEMNWDEEGSTEAFTDEDADLFEEAWSIVVTEKKASASYLQRRMRIGYNKAARLMELMEARGYVSPQIGAKPREILRSA